MLLVATWRQLGDSIAVWGFALPRPLRELPATTTVPLSFSGFAATDIRLSELRYGNVEGFRPQLPEHSPRMRRESVLLNPASLQLYSDKKKKIAQGDPFLNCCLSLMSLQVLLLLPLRFTWAIWSSLSRRLVIKMCYEKWQPSFASLEQCHLLARLREKSKEK